jgi:hypothetical protein
MTCVRAKRSDPPNPHNPLNPVNPSVLFASPSGSWFLRLSLEAVAGFPHRDEVSWLRGIGFQFVAQPGDVLVHRS